MFLRIRLLAVAALALLTVAQAASAQPAANDSPNIAWIAGNDPDMAAAIRQARQGLPAFFAKMATHDRDESGFALKFNLAPTGDPEFIWADQLHWEGGKLTGVLTDDTLTPGFTFGQRVPIADVDIIDWTYFKGRVARGHVTTKVLLKTLSKDDANGVRDYLGWPKE